MKKFIMKIEQQFKINKYHTIEQDISMVYMQIILHIALVIGLFALAMEDLYQEIHFMNYFVDYSIKSLQNIQMSFMILLCLNSLMKKKH